MPQHRCCAWPLQQMCSPSSFSWLHYGESSSSIKLPLLCVFQMAEDKLGAKHLIATVCTCKLALCAAGFYPISPIPVLSAISSSLPVA